MTIKIIFTIALIMTMSYKLCVRKVLVDGNSMYPTLENGDIFFINCLKKPERGDIVVFKQRNNDILVKRIVAISGDTIRFEGNTIYLNGVKLNENYILEKEFSSGYLENGKDYVLGINQVFVLGDNRNNSMDSRNFGFIDEYQILGVTSR